MTGAALARVWADSMTSNTESELDRASLELVPSIWIPIDWVCTDGNTYYLGWPYQPGGLRVIHAWGGWPLGGSHPCMPCLPSPCGSIASVFFLDLWHQWGQRGLCSICWILFLGFWNSGWWVCRAAHVLRKRKKLQEKEGEGGMDLRKIFWGWIM